MVAKGKKKSTPHHTRNPSLKVGISKYSRSASRKRAGIFFVKAKHGGKWPVKAAAAAKPAAKEGKGPRWYPAENEGRARDRSKFRTWDASKQRWVHKKHAAKLRSSITPGTVLIVLSGKFRGKRVVFLKQLPSGLLLITGPFKLSGVPLRRINQAYVIATKTRVELPKLALEQFSDSYFRKQKKQEKKEEKKEKKVFADKGEKKSKGKKRPKTLPKEKIAAQKTVDRPLMATLKKTPYLKAYLRAEFALHKGQYPHRIVF